MLVCSLLEAFRKTHGLRGKIIAPRSREEVCTVFCDPMELVLVDNDLICGPVIWRQLRARGLFYAHFYPTEYRRLFAREKLNLLSAYRRILRVDSRAALRVARPTAVDVILRAEAVAAKLTDPQYPRYALLFPEVNTSPGKVRYEFWEQIKGVIRFSGARPVINRGKSLYDEHGNEICSEIGIALLREIARRATVLVATRSGICDVVADVPTPQVVLYPNAVLDGAHIRTMGDMAGYPNEENRFQVSAYDSVGENEALERISSVLTRE
jgi:hypothetical protein